MFPNIHSSSTDIGILDALNGYKFALSFQLYTSHECKVYWYIDEGGLRFDLEDIRWLWSRYFVKVNNKQQKINKENELFLKNWKKHKKLSDDNFIEFSKQSTEMKIN